MKLPLSLSGLVLAAVVLAADGIAQREIQVIGAPILNRKINLRLVTPAQSTTDKNALYLLISPHSESVTQFPPVNNIFGSFKLDPKLWFIALIAPITASQMDLPIQVPNDTNLVGLTADLQFGDASFKNNRIDLSEEAVVTALATPSSGGGVGTSLFAQGSTSVTIGFAMNRVQNATVGNPQTQNPTFNWDTEGIYYIGSRGWHQGRYVTSTTCDYMVDPFVHHVGAFPPRYLGDGIALGQADGSFGMVKLPTGKRFAIIRDAKNTSDFHAAVINDKDGTVALIKGSKASDKTTSGTTNPYDSQLGFSPDGKLAFVVLDHNNNSSSTATPPLRDKVFLMRLDNSNWPATANKIPGEGTPVLDVSPTLTNAPSFDAFYRSIMVVNEGVVFRGRGVYGSQSTVTSVMWVPWSGAAIARPIGMEFTGVNKRPQWIWFDSHRISKDGKILALPTGSGDPNVTLGYYDELEVYAFTNITEANMDTLIKTNGLMRCITKFPKSTTLMATFGPSRNAANTFNAALSPDGKMIAFIGGLGGTNARGPHDLYVCKTDGSNAGKLVAVKKGTGGFPTTVTWMGTPHWTLTGVVIFGGTATNAMDLYHVTLDNVNPHDGSKATVSNLTNKGDISPRWTLVVENGMGLFEHLFFGRDYQSSATSYALDILGIDFIGKTLFSVTGSEFSTGGPSQELSTAPYLQNFRLRPDLANRNELYFIGRPTRKSPSPF
ncbi:MAG: TolB-like translocation protein, partial [Planctomycetota bacterium]